MISLINENSIIVTSAPGNGSTSMVLALLEQLCENENILYYEPQSHIDRSFVQRFYPKVFNNVLFLKAPIDVFTNFLTDTLGTFNRIVIDPGDILLSKRGRIDVMFPTLIKLCSFMNIKIIITSQIRQDPSKNGNVYSTVEKLNKKLVDSKSPHIKYSCWLLNVTEPDDLFKSKYLDFYSGYRIGNKYFRRFVVKFDKDWGNVVHE